MTLPSTLHPDSIKAWAHELPFANKAVLSRETFDLLNALPQAVLTSGERMEVLETLNHPVGIVLDHLKGQVVAAHPKAPLFLTLGEEFCRRMSAGYHGVADELRSGTGFFNDRAIIAAVKRAGAYHERLLLLRALVHHTPPPGEWDAIKALYLGSKEKHRAPLYRAIALQLCGTNRLPPGKVLKVQALLERLPVEKLIELKQGTPSDGAQGFHLPAGDAPPRYGPVPPDARLLELTSLVKVLDTIRGEDLDPRLLQDLYDHWSDDKRTKERRVAPSAALRTHAVFGFHDILRCLRETPGPSGDEDAATPELTGRTFATAPRHPVAHPVEVLDISERGCRMRCSHEGVSSGDAVAVQWGAGAWRVGSVAWFISEDDHWEFGLEWLVERPRPTLLRFDSPETVPALSGRRIGGDEQVLLHASVHGGYRATCWVQQADGWQRSRLLVLERKGTVEVARVSPMAASRREPRKATTRSAAAPTPVAGPKDAVFEDVWDALSPFNGSAAVSTHGDRRPGDRTANHDDSGDRGDSKRDAPEPPR